MSADAPEPRLRIAYIVGAFPHLPETFVINQIVGVAARGHDVDVYTTWDSAGRDVPAVVARSGLLQRRHRLAARPGWRGIVDTIDLFFKAGWRAPRVMWRLAALLYRDGLAGGLRLCHACLVLMRLKTPRYDVVHAQFGPLGALAAQLVRIGAFSGAIVTSFRGYDLGKYLRLHPRAYDDLFRRGALFLPVSRTLEVRLIEAGCRPGAIRVHHSGVALQQLQYRESYPLDDNVRLVSVARLVEKKGIAYAVEAVAQLLAQGRRVSYTIVGEGPLREQLARLVDELGVAGAVQLVGAKAHREVLEMMRDAHILIAPSVTAADGDEEGIPNAIKEAMAIGLPVIGTRHAGIPELVQDGVSGFLVPERNPGALAERLARLVDNRAVWLSFSRAARLRIEREYDIDRLNDELVTLYRALAQRMDQTVATHEQAVPV